MAFTIHLVVKLPKHYVINEGYFATDHVEPETMSRFIQLSVALTILAPLFCNATLYLARKLQKIMNRMLELNRNREPHTFRLFAPLPLNTYSRPSPFLPPIDPIKNPKAFQPNHRT